MLYVNKSTVTRQLALLEQGGFVTRKPGSAGQADDACVSDGEGRGCLPKGKGRSAGVERQATEGLTEQERDWLCGKLTLLMERAEAEVGNIHDGGREL